MKAANKFSDSSLSPKQKSSEARFRSTFHNTISGKFLDFPSLNDSKNDPTPKNYNKHSTRSSFNNFSSRISHRHSNKNGDSNKSKKSNFAQTSTDFYNNRMKLPDIVAINRSKERPKKRGKANCIGLDLRPATPINVIKITSIGCETDTQSGKMKLTRK